MDLREYLFRKRITNKDFAKLIKYDHSYIGEIANGKKIPGRKLAEAIQEATDGEVTVEELLQIKKTSN